MNIYEHMQAAVDIVSHSPHPTNKIAATIAGENWHHSQTNHWPTAIETTIGRDTQIGNSSGTIHAETACIFTANANGHATKGASIFITDPPCPNCVKNIAEAGITKLHIDHKGFDKDWARRRNDEFENMSLRIAAKAGIDVFVLYRKENRFEVISRHAPDYIPTESHPATIRHCEEAKPTRQSSSDSDGFWIASLSLAITTYENEPFAIALATDPTGNTVSLTTDRHPTLGYLPEDPLDKEGKYSFILQPLNRLLMIAAREGLKLDAKNIYTSRCPTARELVNFIGAGFTYLQIRNKEKARDEHGLLALQQLEDAQILNIQNKT